MGIINVFDKRSTENKATTNLVISTEDDKRSNCVTCITYHPNQNHVVSSMRISAQNIGTPVWSVNHCSHLNVIKMELI